jgi:hypothetical protein
MTLTLWVAARLIRFSWSFETRLLILASSLFVAAAFLAQISLQDVPATLANGLVTLASALFCLRSLAHRLDKSHRLARILNKLEIEIVRLLKFRGI